jgi:hypothetical protein
MFLIHDDDAQKAFSKLRSSIGGIYAWRLSPQSPSQYRPKSEAEFRRLLKEAAEGRTPESDATMAKLLDQYAAVAPWDVSTRQTSEGFIRRTIKPALGHLEVRRSAARSSTSCTHA